jgi:type III pantothenate kinase
MLLAIDIGNTNIVFGVHDGAKWQHHWRVQTVHKRMPDEYAVMFQMLLSEANLRLDAFDHTVLSSVVPQLTQGISNMIQQRTGRAPLRITHDLNLGIEIKTEFPNRLGADLIADAVAAYTLFEDNCIVVDFGTATTFTAVANPGSLLGVAIGAGLNTTIDGLVEKTAQLPQIELAAPPCIIGKNTVHAMQAGLVIGYVCMVEGLVVRIKQELGYASVVATGGLSAVIAPLTTVFDRVEPWLTLDGLRLIAERNS